MLKVWCTNLTSHGEGCVSFKEILQVNNIIIKAWCKKNVSVDLTLDDFIEFTLIWHAYRLILMWETWSPIYFVI